MHEAIRMLLRDIESLFDSMLPLTVCQRILILQIKQMVEMYIKAVYAVGAYVTIKLS